MKYTKNILTILLSTYLVGCSSLLGSLPNPLEPDGINATVAVGKNVETKQSKQLIKVDDIGRTNTNTSNNATSMTNNYTNVNWWLIGALVFLGGLAIPTRSQSRVIKGLQETLEYERDRADRLDGIKPNKGAT